MQENPVSRPKVDYQRGDVNIRSVVIFGVGLALATGFSLLLMWILFVQLESREAGLAEDLQPPTRVAREGERSPPEPILQGSPGSKFELRDPRVEMEAFQLSQEEWLAGFGWVDEKAGVVRIPIDRAKKLLLERGLPVREAEAGDRRPETGGRR